MKLPALMFCLAYPLAIVALIIAIGLREEARRVARFVRIRIVIRKRRHA